MLHPKLVATIVTQELQRAAAIHFGFDLGLFDESFHLNSIWKEVGIVQNPEWCRKKQVENTQHLALMWPPASESPMKITASIITSHTHRFLSCTGLVITAKRTQRLPLIHSFSCLSPVLFIVSPEYFLNRITPLFMALIRALSSSILWASLLQSWYSTTTWHKSRMRLLYVIPNPVPDTLLTFNKRYPRNERNRTLECCWQYFDALQG